MSRVIQFDKDGISLLFSSVLGPFMFKKAIFYKLKFLTMKVYVYML